MGFLVRQGFTGGAPQLVATWGAALVNLAVLLYFLGSFLLLPAPSPPPVVARGGGSEATTQHNKRPKFHADDKLSNEVKIRRARIVKLQQRISALKEKLSHLPRRQSETRMFPMDRALLDPSYHFDGTCKWVDTTECTPYGMIDEKQSQGCQDSIDPTHAGFCQCPDGQLWGKACQGGGVIFCWQVCADANPALAARYRSEFPTARELSVHFNGNGNSPSVKAAIICSSSTKRLLYTATTLRSLQTAFNERYNYPYVIFSEADEHHGGHYRNTISRAVSPAAVSFITPSSSFYAVPRHVDRSRIELKRIRGVPNMDKLSFRQTSRYLSGFFYKESYLTQLDYFWMVSDDVVFPCRIPYDPFLLLHREHKLFGFAMMYHDYMKTIPSLGREVLEFEQHAPRNMTSPMLDHFFREDRFTGCTAGRGSLLGSLAFLRSAEYQAFFQHLDSSAGFFYERWSHEVVMTAAAATLLPSEKWYYFESIPVATSLHSSHLPHDREVCADRLPTTSMSGRNDMSHPCLESLRHLAALPWTLNVTAALS